MSRYNNQFIYNKRLYYMLYWETYKEKNWLKGMGDFFCGDPPSYKSSFAKKIAFHL